MKNRELLNSIMQDIHTIESIIIAKDKKRFRRNEQIFSVFGMLFVIGWADYTFILLSEWKMILGVLVGIGIMPICYWIYLLWWKKNYAYIEPETRGRILSILQKHQELFATLYESESIEAILQKIEIIQQFIQVDIKYLKKKGVRLFKRILEKEIDFITLILIDLRSDLALRLEEQEKILEQAKSEVETNIRGTSELEQVSELQKARLDRQIEQFEELQRILVRV